MTPTPEQLLQQRAEALRRYDRADATWPDRDSPDYLTEIVAISTTLDLLVKAEAHGLLPIEEQGLTYRLLGNVFYDRAMIEDDAYFTSASMAYEIAEMCIKDEVELARVNSSFAKVFMELASRGIEQSKNLEEAIRRYEASLVVYEKTGHEYAEPVRQVLTLLRFQLPLARQKELFASKIAQLEEIKQTQKQGVRDPFLEEKLRAIRGGEPMSTQRSTEEGEAILPPNLLEQLINRVQQEKADGNVEEGRENKIDDMMKVIMQFAGKPADELADMLTESQALRNQAQHFVHSLKYPSYGIPRPAGDTRAGQLVELWWPVREYLARELQKGMHQPGESEELLRLSKETTLDDRKIYQLESEKAAVGFEHEILRRRAWEVRCLSLRKNMRIAYPVWNSATESVNHNSVYYSGSQGSELALQELCDKKALLLLPPPFGEDLAQARWRQLLQCAIALFDFRSDDELVLAAVAYELGIAYALGKPMVVIGDEQHPVPFDVDEVPLIMTGNDDRGRLEQFMDRALFWCREPLDNEQGSVTESIEYALSMPFSGNATQVRPLLHELEKQLDEPDATRVDGILRGLMRFGQAEGAMVLTPRLPGLYPDPAKKFLFHVTKFKGENDWPDTMRERTRAACTQAGINYERGDEQLKPRVITNIWNSICSATHVLVDLTGWIKFYSTSTAPM